MREHDSWRTLNEPRATALLEKLLQDSGRLSAGVSLTLRTPPVAAGQSRLAEPPGIEATIFPTWFVTDKSEMVAGARRRRLVQWRHLNPNGGRSDFVLDDGAKSAVTPIRFVAGCSRGHIQDIDWAYAVHGPASCGQALWLEERGTSGDPRTTQIVCDCGKAISLENAQAPGRFGKCRGKRPWLPSDDPNGCDKDLRFLTRTATNAYFPQVLTVISLPSAEDELTRLVQQHMAILGRARDTTGIAAARMFNDAIAAALEGYSDEDVLARVRRLQNATAQNLEKSPKVAEYELLASGDKAIGENSPQSELYAETLERGQWDGDDQRLAPIVSAVAVHRLREVACLYGFTRFEPAPTSIDGDLEEIYLAVEGADLATDLTWLPAVEQFGEGIFLKFDDSAIIEWLKKPSVTQRQEFLGKGFAHWQGERGVTRPHFPGAPYYAIHALSHALMNEIALDCGYPATALKERIYPLYDPAGAGRFGLLIYTATAGSQGTLGGLLSILPRLGRIITAALDKLALCSSDPICADHEPNAHKDERALSGAACHSCLLVAETSCEQRNLFLDRALVVSTISTDDANLFSS